MRFGYRVPIIIHLVISLYVASQGMWVILPLVDAQLGAERSAQPREAAGVASVGLLVASLPSEQGAVERPARGTLSSEAENVLLLLLGIVLLLAFAAARLWASKKDDGEPTK